MIGDAVGEAFHFVISLKFHLSIAQLQLLEEEAF